MGVDFLTEFSLDGFFVFETPRVVQIRDKWLGVPRFLLILAIVLYIFVWEVLLNEGYLLREQPRGIMISSLRRGTYQHATPTSTPTLPWYCSTKATVPDGNGPPCEYMDDLGALLGESTGSPPAEVGSMFITTRVSISDTPVERGCANAYYSADAVGGEAVLRGRDGRLCPAVPGYDKAAQRDYYVGDIEHFTVMFRHAVFGFLTGHLKYSTDMTGHAVFHTFPTRGDITEDDAAGGVLKQHSTRAAPSGDISFLPRTMDSDVVAARLKEGGFAGFFHGDILTVDRLLNCLGEGEGMLDRPSEEGARATCVDANYTDAGFREYECNPGCFWTGPYCSDFNTPPATPAGAADSDDDNATDADATQNTTSGAQTRCEADTRCYWEDATAACRVVPAKDYCKVKTRRYDGFVVLIVVEYHTPRFHSESDLGYTYVAQVVPGAEFRAVQKTVTAGGNFRFYNRHGIRIMLIQTGSLTKFSFVELLKTLVSGAALLAVADFVIEKMLMKILPRSEIYRSFKYITSVTLSDIHVSYDNPWGPLTAEDFTHGTLQAPRTIPVVAANGAVDDGAPPLTITPPPMSTKRRETHVGHGPPHGDAQSNGGSDSGRLTPTGTPVDGRLTPTAELAAGAAVGNRARRLRLLDAYDGQAAGAGSKEGGQLPHTQNPLGPPGGGGGGGVRQAAAAAARGHADLELSSPAAEVAAEFPSHPKHTGGAGRGPAPSMAAAAHGAAHPPDCEARPAFRVGPSDGPRVAGNAAVLRRNHSGGCGGIVAQPGVPAPAPTAPSQPPPPSSSSSAAVAAMPVPTPTPTPAPGAAAATSAPQPRGDPPGARPALATVSHGAFRAMEGGQAPPPPPPPPPSQETVAAAAAAAGAGSGPATSLVAAMPPGAVAAEAAAAAGASNAWAALGTQQQQQQADRHPLPPLTSVPHGAFLAAEAPPVVPEPPPTPPLPSFRKDGAVPAAAQKQGLVKYTPLAGGRLGCGQPQLLPRSPRYGVQE